MNRTIEALWKESRAGARAGSGFRFQDAAAVAVAVDCWLGVLEGSAIVPEGLDDFVIESHARTTFVQVKSKIADEAKFTPAELNSIFLRAPEFSSLPSGLEIARVVIIDRPFVDESNVDWERQVSEVNAWATLLQGSSSQIGGTLITWLDPLGRAADAIASKKNVARAASLACVYRLLRVVGTLADENARPDRTYAGRARLTVGEIDREINAVLNFIDIGAIDAAAREGLAEFVSFKDALPEEGYYEGVSTVAGHVSAGLVLPRDNLVDAVLSGLFSARRLLIAGPSGAGKSALAYLAGSQSRHACRWIQIKRCSLADREALLRFVNAQEPDDASPIVLYVDDAGRAPGGEWEFACDLTFSRRGVFALGCVREEDLAVTPRLPDCRQVRPQLDEPFALSMWERFKAAGKTSWPFWREPFEQSCGLLLEYAHILTRGQRLRDVVDQQVTQRLTERREAEFEILRLTSAAGSLGASVSSSLLAERLGLNGAAFAAALQRLLNEHLLRQIGHDQLAPLHQLRAKCVLDACMRCVPGTVSQARSAALSVVNADGMRYVLAGAMRAQELEMPAALTAIAERIDKQPDPAVLTGALEGLKIASLDSDAELFAELARRHHIDPGNYFLIAIALSTAIGDAEQGARSVFGTLAAIKSEFNARASTDLRVRLIDALSDASFDRILQQAQSALQIQHLLRSLVGLNLGSRINALMSLGKRLAGAELGGLASTLAMAYDLSPTLAQCWVEALGGERELLDRLWRETPWALRPELSESPGGVPSDVARVQRREVRADLLAVTGDLLSRPDSIVFDHAARALALAPSAEVVTARPLPITGEPIVVQGFSMGAKKIRRENSPSKATVTWNRMLVHAAAAKVATDSVTDVMQRRKETLEIAIRIFRLYADLRCRGRKPKDKDRNELKALAIVEQIAPIVPLERPETALSLDTSSLLTDPTGQLIDEVQSVCERIGDQQASGGLLALDMESISKSIRSCKDDSRWAYVGGPPLAAFDELAVASEDLRQVFLSGISLGSSHEAWVRGSGVKRALERAQSLALRQAAALKTRLSKQLSIPGVNISVLAEHISAPRNLHWPEVDVCVLAAIEDFETYGSWLTEKMAELQAEATKLNSLVIAPLIKDRVIAQFAVRLLPGMSPLLDPEFAELWGGHCPHDLHTSSTCKSFDQALEAILSLHAANEFLAGKILLASESSFVSECEAKAVGALKELGEAIKGIDGEVVAGATKFLVSIYSQSTELSAAEQIRRLMPGSDSEDAGNTVMHRLALIQTGLDCI